MIIKTIRRGYSGAPHRQKGMVATLLAIIVLVATLLAAVALMRSIDTSNTISGSLAFRQGVMQEAERAFVSARLELNTFTGQTGFTDIAAAGYYATLQSSIAANRGLPTLLVSQATSSTAVSGVYPMPQLAAVQGSTATQNNVYYVIERLCPNTGAPDPTLCSVPSPSLGGGSLANQNTGASPPPAFVAYRLSILVKGPKNSLAYVQTIIR
jgi:hypothetical protein